MGRFIEVVGAGSLIESVAVYRADVTLTVRAAQVEIALKEVTELRSECIRQLRLQGLADHELQEGGSEVMRPWFWKKNPGQEASQKLLVSCVDVQRLMGALGSLEPHFESPRFSLSVVMRRPSFVAADGARRQTERAAIADARAKADNAASACDLRLGGVLEIEELDVKTSCSGTYGDADWMSFGEAMAAGGSADEPAETVEAATRTSTIRFRVRFSAEPGA